MANTLYNEQNRRNERNLSLFTPKHLSWSLFKVFCIIVLLHFAWQLNSCLLLNTGLVSYVGCAWRRVRRDSLFKMAFCSRKGFHWWGSRTKTSKCNKCKLDGHWEFTWCWCQFPYTVCQIYFKTLQSKSNRRQLIGKLKQLVAVT